MKTWIDFDGALVYAIPAADGSAVYEGMLIEGPQGWGEFSPPPDCDEHRAARWLTAAIEVGTVGWPDPARGRVPIAVTVPAVDPERARVLVTASGCRSAAVQLAAAPGSLAGDAHLLEAVRDALGPGGVIRCDAGGRWDVDTAVAALPVLDRAAGGLEFVEDPCRAVTDIAEVRRRVQIRVAVGRALRDAEDPRGLDVRAAADVALPAAGALGGVRRALRIIETVALPCAVTAEPRSSIATAGDLALAGVLPDDGFAHELGGVALLAGDVVSAARSLVCDDGFLPVAPMPPGPDRANCESFQLTDSDRLEWWRNRLRAVQRLI